MGLEKLIGQQLMIGVGGTRVTPAMVRLFGETHAGGLILFRRNFLTARGLKQFISNLESALDRKLLVAVDHEGGRVIHLAEGVTFFPDNLALGQSGKMEVASKQGMIEAKELRRLGIDLNLAPTLDVLTENFSPNIGIRSYGRDPELVKRLGVARIKAMQAHGLSACAKHFPGQGQSTLDAHLDFPVLNTSLQEMKRMHLKPFVAAIEADVDCIMTSHPAYPKVERAPTPIIPATFSRNIVTNLLRKELGFKGVILSDDLEMGALRKLCSVEESAVRAVEAGHDGVVVCSDLNAQRRTFNALFEAYQSGRLDRTELEQSVERIERLKKKRKERFSGGRPHAEATGRALAETIAKEGIRAFNVGAHPRVRPPVQGPTPAIKPSAGRHGSAPTTKVNVIFPRLSSLNQQIAIEKPLLNEKKFVREVFRKQGIRVAKIRLVDVRARPASPAGRRAVGSDSIGPTIFFCFDPHLNSDERTLLQAVQSKAAPCAIVFLRDPYGDVFLRPNSFYIKVFGFRCAQIEAAVQALRTQFFSQKVPCPTKSGKL